MVTRSDESGDPHEGREEGKELPSLKNEDLNASLLLFSLSFVCVMMAGLRFLCWRRRNRKFIFGLVLLFFIFCLFRGPSTKSSNYVTHKE